jgi:hypothetical protein
MVHYYIIRKKKSIYKRKREHTKIIEKMVYGGKMDIIKWEGKQYIKKKIGFKINKKLIKKRSII